MFKKKRLFELAAALEGIAIIGLLPGAAAARVGVRYGDVLLEVNGKRVRTFSDYIDATALRDGGMSVLVFRDGKELAMSMSYRQREKLPEHAEILRALEGSGIGGEVEEDELPPS